MPSTFSDLFKKAHGALANLKGGNNLFLGKNGEVIYSKNNVCIHEAISNSYSSNSLISDDNILHIPGYLSIYCLNDDHFGVTLVLQWLPNATLEKNPASIRCVSPRDQNIYKEENKFNLTNPICLISEVEETIDHNDKTNILEENNTFSNRPNTLQSSINYDLSVPLINVIPNTPIDYTTTELLEETSGLTSTYSDSSDTTSGADSEKEDEELLLSSSCDDSDNEIIELKASNMEKYRKDCESLMHTFPEQFAKEHNMILENAITHDLDDTTNSLTMILNEKVVFQQKTSNNTGFLNNSLFSVNLGKMRSMRIFYSNSECTSGELVIASPDSQYKILHFHHGGLDKLAQLFEHWNVVKSKSVHDGSPSAVSDRQLLICLPEVSRTELDPEDGLYNRVSWDFWKSCKNVDGSVDDPTTVRKSVYFASMDAVLRKEIWPFLLRVYSWGSTFEQREAIRNELFLSYQNIKRLRIKKMNTIKNFGANANSKSNIISVENTILKDVVRTDRKNPFFAGENNQNLETMHSILLNYAISHPDINYIQGMSDLLAPLLSTLKDEALSYWCFVNLMGQTLFCLAPASETRNIMEINLEYLRELLKLLVPDFFSYLLSLGGDAPQLMFVHRWILLFFKREFPEADALHLWEACWSQYRTTYFHLFVCTAIVSIYGPDIISQRLPHDEILLYFSSLAMHMDANIVLKKARGLLCNFYRLPRIPCTLGSLCEHDTSNEQWSSHIPQHIFECVQMHGENNDPCPFCS